MLWIVLVVVILIACLRRGNKSDEYTIEEMMLMDELDDLDE